MRHGSHCAVRHIGRSHARALFVAVLAGVAVPLAESVAAEVADSAARDLAATCAACHGSNGVSQGTFANLAGTRKDDLLRALKDFQTATRPATVMQQLAKGYTNAQLELIASWFAEQTPGR